MFGLGKNKTNKKEKKPAKIVAVDFDPQVASQIHVMPRRFYQAPKVKRSHAWILILVGLLFIVGLLVVGYIFLTGNNQPEPSQIPEQITNQQAPDQNINKPVVNLNQGNQAINTSPNPTSSPVVNLNINTNTNSQVNSNVNANVPAFGPDVDRDKLTAVEESLYGTDPNNADTDSDGYQDGSEILSGYNPLKPQEKLDQSNLFKTYANQSYSVIYPSLWQVKSSNQDIIIQSTSGEYFQITKVSNSEKLNLQAWYEKQFGSRQPGISLVLNNLFGLRTADKMNYYLADSQTPDYIYTLSYNLNGSNLINFVTTFNVMVSSFNLIK